MDFEIVGYRYINIFTIPPNHDVEFLDHVFVAITYPSRFNPG